MGCPVSALGQNRIRWALCDFEPWHGKMGKVSYRKFPLILQTAQKGVNYAGRYTARG